MSEWLSGKHVRFLCDRSWVRTQPGHTKDHHKMLQTNSAWHAGIRVGVWQCNLTVKDWVVCGTVSEDMHYKDLPGSGKGWWLLTNLRLRLRLRIEFCAQDSISDSGMVIIKILRLFSYSGLSMKLRNREIGLHLA